MSATIEIGWVIAGALDEADSAAVKEAHAQLLHVLTTWFPEFTWRMPMVRRPEMVEAIREEPVVLLDRGRDERASHQWDFALVITQADFVTHYKPFALAIVSRGLDLGLISTSRIDPAAYDEKVAISARTDAMGGRIQSLALHILGHLSGLRHVEDRENVMLDVRDVVELDSMNRFDDDQKETIRHWLKQVADVRLEEEGTRISAVSFYIQSVWRNRGEVFSSVLQAKPWEFPRRLARLTTAAVSAVVVFMMTAEAWDFALSQPTPTIVILAVAAIVLTTAFISRRQQLFVRRKRRRLTEQRVVTNLTVSAVVLCGMLTMFAIMFGSIFVIGELLFSKNLVAEWAHSVRGLQGDQRTVNWTHYVRFAGIASSLSIVIGALGASFEEQHHFRHITFVDEEV